MLHRHKAHNNTFVVQGEHRLYKPDGSLKEARRSYDKSHTNLERSSSSDASSDNYSTLRKCHTIKGRHNVNIDSLPQKREVGSIRGNIVELPLLRIVRPDDLPIPESHGPVSFVLEEEGAFR